MKQLSTETGQTLKAKNLGKTLVESSDLLRLERKTEQIPGARAGKQTQQPGATLDHAGLHCSYPFLFYCKNN